MDIDTVFYYCGSTVDPHRLVLARDEAHCHPKAMVDRPARQGAAGSFLDTAHDQVHALGDRALAAIKGGDAQGPTQQNVHVRQLRLLLRRGYGVVSQVAARALELQNENKNAVKNLKPNGGICSQANKPVCKAIFGARYRHVAGDPHTNAESLGRIHAQVGITTVQKVSLSRYFAGLGAGDEQIGIVGGAVRDTVVQSPIADIDIGVTLDLHASKKALKTVWERDARGQNGVSAELEIEDVFKTEGIRKMFGMGLLTPIGDEPEGLDIGQLKTKRPLPFITEVDTKFMTWNPKIKMQPDGKTVIKTMLGLTVSNNNNRGQQPGGGATDTEKNAYKTNFRARFKVDPANEANNLKSKQANTFVRVGEFKDTFPRIFPVGQDFKATDYPLVACWKFIRNFMPETIVTHLALKYIDDFRSYECYYSADLVDLVSLGKAIEGRNAQLNVEDSRPFKLHVWAIDDWGFGLVDSEYPPAVNADGKSQDKFVGSDAMLPDEATNQYLYGFSYLQDAYQRDYRVNALYAIYKAQADQMYFVDPLAQDPHTSAYLDLVKKKPCKVGNKDLTQNPEHWPVCNAQNKKKTECCDNSVGNDGDEDGLRNAPDTVLANPEAFEQDLGGQFRFFKMIKKSYTITNQEQTVATVCRFMLLRLEEMSSAMNDKIHMLFFKRLWKKLFDDADNFETVKNNVKMILTEMSKNQQQCLVTWNTLVKNAGQILYGDSYRVHKLVAALYDDHEGQGAMKVVNLETTAKLESQGPFHSEEDVPDSHARFLAASILDHHRE
eukprot:TRINITY_DN5628_c0_g1_i1.p1 TRINITY_DN5628_c0_g1~~TRINITY_DN5628_c0_g1_i1.p1  ORF type:complete len:841 (+),score=139.42 TRINITY_DN5628_c0_g1_i1:190-2523(+)